MLYSEDDLLLFYDHRHICGMKSGDRYEKSPTVLAFVDGIQFDSSNKLEAFGIGGSRARVQRPVSAYRRYDEATGAFQKYYAYSDRLPDTDNMADAVEEIFTTPDAAAQHGYYNDPMYR